MSTEQLVEELLRLPIEEQMDVAEILWRSISGAKPPTLDADDPNTLAEVRRRYEEVRSGRAVIRSHEEVMASIRHRLGCG